MITVEMKCYYFIVIIALFGHVFIHISLGGAEQVHVPLIGKDDELIEEGRRQLLRMKSQMPRYHNSYDSVLSVVITNMYKLAGAFRQLIFSNKII